MAFSSYLWVAAGSLYVLHRLNEYRKAIQLVDGLPGFRTLINYRVPLPWQRMRGVTVNWGHFSNTGYEAYEQFGCEIISNVSGWPFAVPVIHIADPEVIKELSMSRHRFPKPVQILKVLNYYGPNIVSAEGDEWKRHRKPVAPAFSDRNNKLVWDETTQIVRGMFESRGWQGKDVVTIDHAIDITLPIALFVIGVAGFGQPVDWNENDEVPAGHKMAFKGALHHTACHLVAGLFLPKWAFSLRNEWRLTKIAFDELRLYMREMIKARRDGTNAEQRFDLFSALLDEGLELTDEELMGNVFIFLIAGHETTAHTLAFAFGLLAIYQEEQEKLYQHIMSIVGDGHEPTYDEMPKFTYSLAVLYETMRLYTPVPEAIKTSAEETILTAYSAKGPRAVRIRPGIQINLCFASIHKNPRYWSDPDSFKPERFLGDWPRDAFMPFAVGARSCLGRKFFETEGLAVMTTLISRYKITVKDEPQFRGLDRETLRHKLLRNTPGITLTPHHVPLVFTRR